MGLRDADSVSGYSLACLSRYRKLEWSSQIIDYINKFKTRRCIPLWFGIIGFVNVYGIELHLTISNLVLTVIFDETLLWTMFISYYFWCYLSCTLIQFPWWYDMCSILGFSSSSLNGKRLILFNCLSVSLSLICTIFVYKLHETYQSSTDPFLDSFQKPIWSSFSTFDVDAF